MIYKGGDSSRRGFRFLCGDIICADFCEENFPIESYIEDLTAYVNENNIDKLFICDSLKEKTDISFLYNLKSIKYLQISAKCNDITPIYSLKLKVLKLQIQDECLNFEALKDNLEELDLYNIYKDNKLGARLNVGILACKRLRYLGIADFDFKDCEIISKMDWLERLDLADSYSKNIEISCLNKIKNLKSLALQRVSLKSLGILNFPLLKSLKIIQIKIESLNGIENFKELEELEVCYCPKLKDIEALAGCFKLRKLHFECDKRIGSFSCLGKLQNLRGLIIGNCGNIESLDFINDMANLQFFSFIDTNIVDGDLIPCLRLKCVGTMNKRHYNLKESQLPHDDEYAYRNV